MSKRRFTNKIKLIILFTIILGYVCPVINALDCPQGFLQASKWYECVILSDSFGGTAKFFNLLSSGYVTITVLDAEDEYGSSCDWSLWKDGNPAIHIGDGMSPNPQEFLLSTLGVYILKMSDSYEGVHKFKIDFRPYTPPSAYCGDGSCNGGETCSTCSSDCGTCPVSAYCGDGSCNGGETCSTCSSDCGTCQTGKKEDYWACTSASECESGNCLYLDTLKQKICCPSGTICCDKDYECEEGYICESPRCVKPGAKDFCYECASNSDCKSRVCKWFTDGINRCTTNDPDVLCCPDKHHITYFKQGIDCCVDSACSSGYKCINYKCTSDLTTTSVKKADGEDCFTNDECISGNCNFNGIDPIKDEGGFCCLAGKKCCEYGRYDNNIIHNIEGRHDNWLCTEDHYLTFVGYEDKEGKGFIAEKCPSGTCDVVEGCTRGGRAELSTYVATFEKCIGNNARGELKRKDNSVCKYICCDGVIKDYGEPHSVPDCCTNAGCPPGKECWGNYCIEKPSGRITEFFKGIFKFFQNKCASSSQCEEDEYCSEQWECKKLACLECSGVKDHKCFNYECCSNSDCGELQKCETSLRMCVDKSNCIKIIDNGDSNSKIDVAFIGDEYSNDEELKEDVLKLVDYEGNNGHYGLMSLEPFKSEKNKFNIWMMNVGFSIPHNSATHKPDTVKGREIAAKCTASDYQIIVSKKADYRSFCFFGGACFVSLGNGIVDSWDGKVLLHEFAHGFGRIADEYIEEPVGNKPKEPNCVSDKAEAEKLWGDLVKTQSGYGYYEGCSYTKNNFRPTPTSIMKYPYSPDAEFYLVNDRYMQLRLEEYK